MYAPSTYHPMELIHSEEPFVKVLRRSLKDILCEGCHEGKTDLKACMQCLAVKYCSKRCQKADWHDHKLECKRMKNLQKGDDEDFVRLLGRVILKIKGKEWKSIQVPTLKSVATFNHIKSHCATMKEDPLFTLLCRETKKLVGRFIGEENMPEESILIEIMGKIKYNAFMTSKDAKAVGLFLFIGASLFHHECIPNANFAVVNNVLKMWAIKKIHKGTEKITISFREIISTNHTLIDNTLVERCKCVHCSLPYGKSQLSKVLKEDEAYSVIVETVKALEIMDIALRMNEDVTMEEYIDELLDKQSGVLGATNVLRLKLLGFKCFRMDNEPLMSWICLKELERNMRMVFGEYSMELVKIYEKLLFLSLALRHPDIISYLQKIKKITVHCPHLGI